MGEAEEKRRKQRDKMRAWRAANPERAKESSRKSSKKWRKENPSLYKERKHQSYLKHRIEECARNQKWQRDNKDHVNEYHRATYPKYRKQISSHQMMIREACKRKVFIYYSGADPPQCVDPYGVHEKEGHKFEVYYGLQLDQLDHVSDNGSEERSVGLQSITLHKHLIKNNFPAGYQVLCANCNHLKEVLRQEMVRLNTRTSRNSKRHRERTKYLVVAYYSRGQMRCANPYNIHSEKDSYLTDVRVLTIDHVEDGGNLDRKAGRGSGTRFYKWLIKNKLPEGYQVLCCSCQWIKELNRRKHKVKISGGQNVSPPNLTGISAN